MKGKVFAVLALGAGACAGVYYKKKTDKKLADKEAKVKKFKDYYKLMNEWLELSQQSKSLATYFTRNHYKKIAIYGMGELGNRLVDELDKSEVKVAYAFDKKVAFSQTGIEVRDPEAGFDGVEADVIVVTATFAFDEIAENISTQTDIPVVSLAEVVRGAC